IARKAPRTSAGSPTRARPPSSRTRGARRSRPSRPTARARTGCDRMHVLQRWSPRAAALVNFKHGHVDRCAMGIGSQHLMLSLWAFAEQSFCFKAGNERLFIGLV